MDLTELAQFTASGLTLGGIYAIVALSFTIVFNTTGVVNFAQGEGVMLAGLLATTMVAAGLPLLVGSVATVLAMAIFSAVIYMATIARVRQAPMLTAILVTLGTAIVLEGAAQIIWGTVPRRLPPLIEGESLDVLGARITPQAILVMVSTAVLMGALFVFFTRTRAGQAMLACSENREGAALVGIETAKFSLLAFVLAGALSGIAGILVTPFTSALYSVGLLLTLKGFAAAVLGGFGNPLGAVIGGFLLGLLEAYGGGFVSSGYQDGIGLAVLVAMLLVRPTGLLGSRVLAS